MKGLTAVLCLDDRGGMTFNKRRQSRDRLLIKDLCDTTEGDIYMESYSLPLFAEYEDRARGSADPVADCPEGGVCFIERTNPDTFVNKCRRLIIYRWNRTYPSDLSLDGSATAGFTLREEYDFVGSSHEKITKGIYER